MGKKSYKRIRKSKRYSRRRGGEKKPIDHSDIGIGAFDVFLGGRNETDGVKDLDVAMSEFDLFEDDNKNDVKNNDNVKELDEAMSEFDLFDEPVQNASMKNDFGDMSMISRESDSNNLNESMNVLDEDDETVAENSIPFDEEDWMNLDEGFLDEDGDRDDSYLNETTNESISFGGKKTRKRRKVRRIKQKKTMKKRRGTRKIKRRKYNNATRRHIKRIKLGGNIDRMGSVDFNPNLAFDKKQMGGKQMGGKQMAGKQMGGQNIGGNCTDPNFSIYNTPMLKLFPYKA